MGRPEIVKVVFRCKKCNFSTEIRTQENSVASVCKSLALCHKDFEKCDAVGDDFILEPVEEKDRKNEALKNHAISLWKERKEDAELLLKDKFSLSDIIGNDEIKEMIIEEVVEYVEQSDELQEVGFYPSSGIILAGIQGTGKTQIVKAALKEIMMDNKKRERLDIALLSGNDFTSSGMGESGKGIEYFCQVVRDSNKKNNKKTIFFIDEIDVLLTNRDSHSVIAQEKTTTFLREFGGVHDDHTIKVIGTTNRPEKIDSELLVAGRFGNPLLQDIPTDEDLWKMFKKFTTQAKIVLDDDITSEFVSTQFRSYTGRDMFYFVKGLVKIRNKKKRNGEHHSEPIITRDDIIQLYESSAWIATPSTNVERLKKISSHFGRHEIYVRGSPDVVQKEMSLDTFVEDRLYIDITDNSLYEFTDVILKEANKYIMNDDKVSKTFLSRYILDILTRKKGEKVDIVKRGKEGERQKAYPYIKLIRIKVDE